MLENFQQTVDLREQAERRKTAAAGKNKITPLEKIYEAGEPGETGKDFQKINQPKTSLLHTGLIRRIVFSLAIIVLAATVYSLFFRHKSSGPAPWARGWYAVKLVDGEVFYGQIADVKADPITLANVYYNYDQAKAKEASKADEAGSLKLVKRGQETHGPSGTMDIVRAQVLFMEPLKNDSKVLRAILQYEK